MILLGNKRVCTGFVTRYNMTVGNLTLTLPLVQNRAEGALSYNFYVNWGDGSSSHVIAYNDLGAIHTYASAGKYTVEIRGTCEGWSFNNSSSAPYLIEIVNWGRTPVFGGFKYLANGFYGCSNLTTIASGPIPASGTGILSDGFYLSFANCSKVTSIPADLFRYHAAISSQAFYGTFHGCTTLRSIPIDLFRYNTAVSSGGFQKTFIGCVALASIPTDLFRYNPLVGTDAFNQTFYNC